MVSVSRAQQLAHVTAEPAEDGSKKDLLLARAKVGSAAGWASGEQI